MGLVNILETGSLKHLSSIPIENIPSISFDFARGFMEFTTHPLNYFMIDLFETFGYSLKGDGHPVIVKPGFGATDHFTYPLRNFLEKLDYKVYEWGAGVNIPKEKHDYFFKHNQKLLNRAYYENNRKRVSIIGWSLGGLYAREIARENPKKIRQIITLGTPFNMTNNDVSIKKFFHDLTNITHDSVEYLIEKYSESPNVHNTSLYTKGDGIVNYHCSIQKNCVLSENIEMPFWFSHVGLPYNPFVLYTIAKLLQTPVKKLRTIPKTH